MYCTVCKQDHDGTGCPMHYDQDMPVFDEGMNVIEELKEKLKAIEEERDGWHRIADDRSLEIIRLLEERDRQDKTIQVAHDMLVDRQNQIAALTSELERCGEGRSLRTVNEGLVEEMSSLENSNKCLTASEKRLRRALDGLLDHDLANRDTKDEFFRCYTYPPGTIPKAIKIAKAALAGKEKGDGTS